MEFNKFKWMIKKDLLTLWRHKVQFVSLILFPVVMVALCGWGMGGTVENTPVIIVKQTSGHITDEAINTIKSDTTYDVKDITDDADKAKEKVDKGEVKAAIILSSNFEDSDSRSAVLYIDSSDQLTTQTLVPTTQKVFASLSEQVRMEEMASSYQNMNALSQTAQAIKLQVNRIYGDIKYIDFLLPGVLAMTISMSAMMTMGNSIAGERERGELARLFMTPTSVSTVIGGKIISQLLREMIRTILLIVVAVLLFNVVINGNILVLFLVLLISTLCFVGFGMMFSATAKTQEDYIQIILPVVMPMMFICGVFFPTETMPWILQKIAYFMPLTYANDALRAVMLQGASFDIVAYDLLILLLFTLLFFAVGVMRFNRDI